MPIHDDRPFLTASARNSPRHKSRASPVRRRLAGASDTIAPGSGRNAANGWTRRRTGSKPYLLSHGKSGQGNHPGCPSHPSTAQLRLHFAAALVGHSAVAVAQAGVWDEAGDYGGGGVVPVSADGAGRGSGDGVQAAVRGAGHQGGDVAFVPVRLGGAGV